jgi:dihydroorotate dehydrogenase
VAYRLLYKLVLRRIPPETAHSLAVTSLRAAAPLIRRRPSDLLGVDALGLRFRSPLGVAAGLDKNGEWFTALGAIGFGFAELGTVTPRAQAGNDKPRIARVLADEGLVNRMGFPNLGADALAARLASRHISVPGGRAADMRLGINLGKNRDTPLERAAEDYAAGARVLGALADYVVINVSSPNTPGLRALESVEALRPIIDAVCAELPAGKPLLVKISPDLADADVDAVAELAVSSGLAGVIATNTTVEREVLSGEGRAAVASFDGGGVSGPPLAPRSLEVLARLYSGLRGSGVIVISVGGITTADDVWQRILAGATLVQAYTGFIYGGPGWPAQINRELAARVKVAGATSISELIGSGAPA